MPTLGEISVKIRADITDLERKLSAAEGRVTKFEKSTSASSSSGVTSIFSKLNSETIKTTAGMNMLRGSLTSMAGAALGTAPGVAQLGSALGLMSIGTPLVVGILAGLAAISFAWEKITASARESKKVIEDALKAARGPLGELSDKLDAARAEEAAARAHLAAVKAGTTWRIGAGADTPAEAQKKIVDAHNAVLRLEQQFNEQMAANEDKRNGTAAAALQKRLTLMSVEVGAHRASLSQQLALIDREMKGVQKGSDAWITLQQARTATLNEMATAAEKALKASQALRLEAAKHSVLGKSFTFPVNLPRTAQQLTANAPALRAEALGLNEPFDPSAEGAIHRGPSLGTQLGARGADQFGAAKSQIMDLVASFSPLGIAATALGGLFQGLQPVLEALKEPIRLVGEIFGKALAPVLKALFPVFQIVAIAATYVGEYLFKFAAVVLNVVSFIERAVGGFIEGIGRILGKIPLIGGLFKPLEAAGAALKKHGEILGGIADGFEEGADALSKGREELKDLKWDDVLDPATKAVDNFAGALNNAARGFKIDLRRFQATTGIADPRSAARAGGGVTITGPVTVVANNPQELVDSVERQAAAKKARGYTGGLTLGYT